MTDLETPWLMPESTPAETEWFDEGPFSTDSESFVPEAPQDFVSPGAAWPESPFEVPILAPEIAGSGETVRGCGGPVAGTPPLILRGSTAERSRNPWVGRAQALLNVWLARRATGVSTCTDEGPVTAQYIALKAVSLMTLGQSPLVVDCTFGEGTETATLMFQACQGLVRDGKIGEKTWPRLLALESPAPAPTPTPTPTPTPPTPTPGVRVREDVWALSAISTWHPTLLWYARAVAALKGRDVSPFGDPRCWRHLAETHGQGEATRPPGALWNQCEHLTWHFLPWHRAYLHHFEKIVRDEILRLGGPADWALPFWNYSDTRAARQLPPAFKATTWPGPGDNPLREPRRGPEMNASGELREEVVDTTQMFQQTVFTPPTTSIGAGFGGTRGPVGSHTGAAGSQMGALEDTPHGLVHGGVGGLMSSFNTAARDPIFWLHHANVDRLWEAWRRSRPGNTNPTEIDWLSAQWTFGSGATTTRIFTRDLVDTRTLGYRYSDMPAVPTPELEGWGTPVAEVDHEAERPAELVGASGEIPLGPRPSTVRVALGAPAGPSARPLREAGGVPTGVKVFLRLENITGTVVHASGVVVYVNIPQGGRAADFPDRKAGTVSLFGVVETSRRDDRHSGSGKGATIEITRIARALAAAGQWDPAKLDVSLVPIPDATGRVGQGDVKVGRISVFYA